MVEGELSDGDCCYEKKQNYIRFSCTFVQKCPVEILVEHEEDSEPLYSTFIRTVADMWDCFGDLEADVLPALIDIVERVFAFSPDEKENLTKPLEELDMMSRLEGENTDRVGNSELSLSKDYCKIYVNCVMTWREQSKRDFSYARVNTPSCVGPGSYTLPGTQIPTEKPRQSRCNRELRETLPPPDLITPGPGAYNTAFREETKQRPVTSMFKSKTERKIGYYIPDTPAGAEYGYIRDWTKRREVKSTPHHPARKKRTASFNQTCNYLDERGRLVYRPEVTHTIEDIGPGTYVDQSIPFSRRSEINRNERTTAIGKRPEVTPSPDKYTIGSPDTRLPVTIKGQYDLKQPKALCDEMISAPNKKQEKRPNSVFQSRVPRDIYAGSRGDVSPGPCDYTVTHDKKPRVVTGLAFGSRAVRFDKSETATPGPSDYFIPRKRVPMSESSSFKSKTVARDPLQNTPESVGPGSYNLQQATVCPRKSPVFSDASIRMGSDANGIPGPADYNIKREVERSASVLNTRYQGIGNWLHSSTVSPSPENYSIDRDLHGRGSTIPRARNTTKKVKESLGPGSYEICPSMLKKSYNARVPRN